MLTRPLYINANAHAQTLPLPMQRTHTHTQAHTHTQDNDSHCLCLSFIFHSQLREMESTSRSNLSYARKSQALEDADGGSETSRECSRSGRMCNYVCTLLFFFARPSETDAGGRVMLCACLSLCVLRCCMGPFCGVQ